MSSMVHHITEDTALVRKITRAIEDKHPGLTQDQLEAIVGDALEAYQRSAYTLDQNGSGNARSSTAVSRANLIVFHRNHTGHETRHLIGGKVQLKSNPDAESLPGDILGPVEQAIARGETNGETGDAEHPQWYLERMEPVY